MKGGEGVGDPAIAVLRSMPEKETDQTFNFFDAIEPYSTTKPLHKQLPTQIDSRLLNPKHSGN
jgi:hypothetical protein